MTGQDFRRRATKCRFRLEYNQLTNNNMERLSWRETAHENHNIAKAKGWWGETDEEYKKGRSMNRQRLLVISELMEAYEALRAGNMVGNVGGLEISTDMVKRRYDRYKDNPDEETRRAAEVGARGALVSTGVKGCFAIELADAVIRLLDWAAWAENRYKADKVNWDWLGDYSTKTVSEEISIELQEDDLFRCVRKVCNIFKPWREATLQAANILELMHANGLDPVKWIRLKMMYNELRPYKHGKNF